MEHYMSVDKFYIFFDVQIRNTHMPWTAESITNTHTLFIKKLYCFQLFIFLTLSYCFQPNYK